MGIDVVHPLTIKDLGRHLIEYRNSLPRSAKSSVRIRAQEDRISLTIAKGSGLRVLVDSSVASLLGNRLPKLAFEVLRFQTKTDASAESTRLLFTQRVPDADAHPKRKSSTRDQFSARVRDFFDSTVLSQVHEAALKDALRAPTEFQTILRALEQPEVAASVRDQDPLVMARLRGIESKRRILTDEGGMLSAERVGEMLTISRQAVEKRRKAGRLIGVSLGRRGFGYPAWQLSEGGILPGLEGVLKVLKPHDAWTKLVFLTSENASTDGQKPLNVLRSGKVEKVLAAARIYGEQGAV
jgi:hypothetical protein